MAHLVITIGCEYGAKGNQIGRKVADDLGIRFYDREMVDEIIREVGIPKEIMEKVEEGVTIAGKGAEGDVRGSFSKYADLTERAIHVQKTIIRKLSARESCVIIGRSADYILKEQKPILRIFIYAPNDVRVKMSWRVIISRKTMRSFLYLRRIKDIIRDIWHLREATVVTDITGIF